ncbi:Metal-dependent hydrolases of the beta-lactamase superfamily I; PhnP protein [Hyphomicrobiales bacterium]|nr:Metal-dependent hydrolases of the beta-lactamase superfamily I; PhnP protein [Hyphomicrobiales bacterium]CAH1701687.1 Metal-dependent hydrolases of the beta-lactamase superfamily I; PhnP protein [Hyphomicrobiales bacterium]CAI0345844.1 phosphoribosyl 1,2-cyclic phosphate phosphodiesterase [Hyphomicrobiales bacterium]
MTLTVTILGCGSSGGVPRPGSGWGACDPTNPKNRRRRCSILVERSGLGGTTRVLVDTSPDLREQLLSAEVPALDGVLLTHDHADHLHGIDDLRALVLYMGRRIRVYADTTTEASLRSRFGYLFETPAGSYYPPILDLDQIIAGRSQTIDGSGGPIEALPFRVEHGPNYEALGFRFADFAYLPDVSLIPPAAMDAMADLDMLVLDCLRETPHVSHFHLERSLEAIAALKPRRAILTNLHVDLDYASLTKRLAGNIDVAFDGMTVTVPI